MGQEAELNLGIGIRLEYFETVIICVRHDTKEENLQTAKEAISLLIGYSIADIFEAKEGHDSWFNKIGGTIERFKWIASAR